MERFVAELIRDGIGVRALVPQQATLEQLFFQLTEPGGHQPLAPLPGWRR